MEENFFQTLFLTLKLASLTTVILFAVSIPIALYLSRSQGILKSMLEITVTLPLVLPPTVIGFYLLVLLSPNGYIGFIFIELFDVKLIFSFTGLVLGSIIYSLPFMVQPIHAGLEKIPKQLIEASYLMGKSKWQTLLKVQNDLNHTLTNTILGLPTLSGSPTTSKKLRNFVALLNKKGPSKTVVGANEEIKRGEFAAPSLPMRLTKTALSVLDKDN